MEPIQSELGRVRGIELLFFDNAEVEKIKGDSTSFASTGGLSVLYFKDFNRFVLRLNDWFYPLLRRLSISKSGSSYILPALNGFSYRLSLNSAGNMNAISNFESILHHNSGFSVIGFPQRLEASPDDRVVRHVKSNTGPKEVISEMFKQTVSKAKNITKTVTSGTTHLTSRRKKMNLQDIKNKNFKKRAHSKIKKDFFDSNEKLTHNFLTLRRDNPNLTQSRGFDEMMKLSENYFPSLFFSRQEIEDAILNNKDITSPLQAPPITSTIGTHTLTETFKSGTEHKGGFLGALKQGLHEIKDTFTHMMTPGPAVESKTDQGPSVTDKIKSTLAQASEGLTAHTSMVSQGLSANTTMTSESLDVSNDSSVKPQVMSQTESRNVHLTEPVHVEGYRVGHDPMVRRPHGNLEGRRAGGGGDVDPTKLPGQTTAGTEGLSHYEG